MRHYLCQVPSKPLAISICLRPQTFLWVNKDFLHGAYVEGLLTGYILPSSTKFWLVLHVILFYIFVNLFSIHKMRLKNAVCINLFQIQMRIS